MNQDQLRTDIIDEIGPDAHSLYDEERYAIPEIILHLLADACIIEFLKGFFDFEGLGKGARDRFGEFIREFRQGPELVTLNISGDVDHALTAARVPSDEAIAEAREHLVNLLTTYGMHPDIAKAHAAVIEQSILSALPQ